MTGRSYAVEDGIVSVRTPLGEKAAARSSGMALKRAGFAVLVVGIVSGIVFNSVGSWVWVNNFKLLWVILYILSPTLAFSGGFLYWRGRQYAAQASAKSIITDAKPHLLYLRPFRSDGIEFHGYRRPPCALSRA